MSILKGYTIILIAILKNLFIFSTIQINIGFKYLLIKNIYMYKPIAIHRYTYIPIKAQLLYNKNMNIAIAAKHQNNISSIIFIIGLKFLSILILL